MHLVIFVGPFVPYESGLKISYWAPKVPFFCTQKWPLLEKVPIFTCRKMTFGWDFSQFLNVVLFLVILHCKTAIFGTSLVGGLKMIRFQKIFLILFYITKLQYKPHGPIGKLTKSQIRAFKSPSYSALRQPSGYRLIIYRFANIV